MKIKKLGLLFVFGILHQYFAIANGYNFEIDGIYYAITSTDDIENIEVKVCSPWNCYLNGAILTRKTETYIDTLNIPEYVIYQGVSFHVTSIDDLAFAGCDIKAIFLPQSIKKIGKHAFMGCDYLKEIKIPEGVKEIEEGTFAAKQITNIILPEGLTRIGKEAFNCPIENIKLPSSLEHLGGQAFVSCNKLKSIDIPYSLKTADGGTFYWCTSLATVSIDCPVIPSNLRFIGCPLTSLLLKENVTKIEGSFLEDFKDVTIITCLSKIPPTVESHWIKMSENSVLYVPLGSGTLYKKDKFWGKFKTIVEITQDSEENYSSKIIGKWELTSSTNYSHSYVEFKNDGSFLYTDSEGYCEDRGEYFIEGDYLYEFYQGEDDYIKSKIIHLDNTDLELVFNEEKAEEVLLYVKTDSENSNITHVTLNGIYYNVVKKNRTAEVVKPNSGSYSGDIVIPETITYEGTECSVVSIGSFAFHECKKLYSISLPKSLKYIHKNAFSWCSNLYSVTIPEKVLYIGDNSFVGCKISSIIIPQSVNYGLKGSTFMYCNNLTSIIVEDGNSSYDSRNNCNAIIKKESNCLIAGCSTSFIPDGVIEIGPNAFYYNESLKTVIIPNSVLYIRGSAFAFCSNISSLQISNSITEIEAYAFRGCSKLSSVLLPSSIKYIGNYAFYDCNNLVSFSIGRNIKKIGRSIFGNDYKLKNVYCFAEDIPTTDDSFDENTIINVTLHVPASSLFQYSFTYPWNAFGNIVELTGEEMKVDIKPIQYINSDKNKYSIDGKNMQYPTKGINIIKMKDGTTKKVLVK